MLQLKPRREPSPDLSNISISLELKFGLSLATKRCYMEQKAVHSTYPGQNLEIELTAIQGPIIMQKNYLMTTHYT